MPETNWTKNKKGTIITGIIFIISCLALTGQLSTLKAASGFSSDNEEKLLSTEIAYSQAKIKIEELEGKLASLTSSKPDDNNNDSPIMEDTAVIITSSWIQTHPTLFFIDHVIDSLKLIEGLSPTVPIYIAVDGLRTKGLNATTTKSRLKQLDGYVEMLHHKYSRHNNIRIFARPEHKHILGNEQTLLALVKDHHPSTEFVYYLQHDFAFKPGVNHTALVNTMKENDDVRIVRFLYRCCGTEHKTWDKCKHKPIINSNGISLKATGKYSDNNHFARFDFYKEVIDGLVSGWGKNGTRLGAPEGPMQWINIYTDPNCTKHGIYTYSSVPSNGTRVTLDHLDGRKSKSTG